MLYKYPQVAFPYDDLVAENGRRSQRMPEFELFDAIADAFREQRYFDVFVEYAKIDAEDFLCRIRAINRYSAAAPVHVLPHLWYRNTWSWTHGEVRPVIRSAGDAAVHTRHPRLGDRWWYARSEPGVSPDLLFTENDTNVARLYGAENPVPHVKDGINDAVVARSMDRVSRTAGSKVAAHFSALVEPGDAFTVQVRLSPRARTQPFAEFEAIFDQRQREADDFYDVTAEGLTDDERLVQRQAFAGLLWSKQFYHFDVHRWLSGDPTQPAPPAERLRGRNREWSHVINEDVLLMPDKWEYPWFASWDLAFQAVVMAAIDPAFAKQQILLLTSHRYQHPYGTVPAYEWDFGAVNPPLMAWAAWQIYRIDRERGGEEDVAFLESVFDALVLMLGWWLNRKDAEGKGIFGGGFLGLDNIGVFDRDRPLPTGGSLEQTDATGWMALFQLNMAQIAVELARHHARYEPFVHRCGQHFVIVANVLQRTAAGGIGLWSAEEQFYFDMIRHETERVPLKIYSMVGLVPLFAAGVLDRASQQRARGILDSAEEIFRRRPYLRDILPAFAEPGQDGARLLSVLDGDRLRNILRRVLDESQFLSEYGVRSLSREHLDHPYVFEVAGEHYEIAYRPGVSDNRVFGGNSNWRGPIWFPLNYLLVQALETFGVYYGDDFTIECPTGSGRYLTLRQVSDHLTRRLTRIFLRDETRRGRRAVLGDNEYFQQDPEWRDYIPFHEFFHGDSGMGLGASHQTGWTALVALLLQPRGARRPGIIAPLVDFDCAQIVPSPP
jgi:hypothetical protein